MGSTVVVSDLHMGARPLDVFGTTGAESFVSCLVWLPLGTTLVLAGDVWDFLTAPPYDRLDVLDAPAKARLLAAEHADVMEAVARFGALPGNRVVVLPGNHDPEVCRPDVWAALWSGLPSGLEPPPLPRPSFTFTAGSRRVRVEHGDRPDPLNATDYLSVPWDTFQYPRGSRYVVDTVNPIARELPWVKTVLPEWPAVPILVSALRPDLAVSRLPGELTRRLRDLAEPYLSGLMGDGPGLSCRVAARALARLNRYAQEGEPGADEFAEAALACPEDLTIFGHTHTAKIARRGARLYLNAGTWQEQLILPPGGDVVELSRWIDALGRGDYPHRIVPTFVRVNPDGYAGLYGWDGWGENMVWEG